MLTLTGIEPAPFWSSTSKVAGLQVHATTCRCFQNTVRNFEKWIIEKCAGRNDFFAKLVKYNFTKIEFHKDYLWDWAATQEKWSATTHLLVQRRIQNTVEHLKWILLIGSKLPKKMVLFAVMKALLRLWKMLFISS